MRPSYLFIILLAIAGTRCDESTSSIPSEGPLGAEETTEDSANSDIPPESLLQEAPSSTGLQAFYETLHDDVETWGYENGNWTEDFGDGAAFGAFYFSNLSHASQDETELKIAQETMEYNLSVVTSAGDDVNWALEHLEEVFMACQGLIEYAGVFDDESVIPPLDKLIDEVMDPVLIGFGDYVDISIGEFAADLYGPTAITAGVAVIYSQYALYLDTALTATRLERAAEILDHIHEKAWDAQGNRYLFRPEVDTLYLYPNATMIIAMNRVYALSGEARFIERAESVYQGIQPLRKELGYYQSPYSQEYQGAETDEYGTLSAQNYLMIGLLLMHENTQKGLYKEEVIALLNFVSTSLYDAEENKLLHHWIDGRPALDTDPDYFCSGCNLQVLYILWYLKNEIGEDLNT